MSRHDWTVHGLVLAALALAGALIFGGAVIAQSGPGLSDTLALRRVMISSGGVAYYEFEAPVTGEAAFTLPVRFDQVDDVLKSIVVYDNLGGDGTVQLPSRAPLTDIFRGLPFGPSALDSGPALITALKGAEVQVSGPERIEGRIVAVAKETAKGDNDLVITRNRVSVITAQGLRQFVLEDAEAVSFRDPRLQAQIDSALASVAQHREGQARTLTIRSRGTAERIVTVGFVAEAPLWKSAYRITTADGQSKAWLQGWAILENVSGHDWKDVELTVTSGNPVTFRQALYDTYYVNRPNIPVEVLGRVLPRTDDGAVADAVASEHESGRTRSAAKALPRAQAAPAPAPMMAPMESAETAAGLAGGTVPSLDVLAQRGQAADSKEAATQVTFRLPGKISVLNGQSLSVPIVNTQAGAERVALYQPSTSRRHPLAAVKLTNDTGSSLPPGVVTLYERDPGGNTAYVGDAQLSALPMSETRLLAFALDQKVIVDSDAKSDQSVTKISIANGVAKVSRADSMTTVYTVKGAAREPRTLILEHPRQEGWTLTAPDAKTVEKTDSAFRIPYPLKADETAKITVSTEWVREEGLALLEFSADEFLIYARNMKLTEAQRAAFDKLAKLRQDVGAFDPQIETENAARDRVFEEQKRIRENLDSVPDKSDLQARYLRSMGELEDQAEKHKKALDDLEAKRAAAQKVLADAIGALNL